MTRSDRKALVIGYGNRLRGDDAIGLAVAEALANDPIAGTEVVICHQLTPELAERLAAVETAVFIDATSAGDAGRVRVTRLLAVAVPVAGLAHHIAPQTLLVMSLKLYGRSPEAFLVTVAAGSFDLGDGLSDAVSAALPEAVATVRRLLHARHSVGQERSESTTDPSTSTN